MNITPAFLPDDAHTALLGACLLDDGRARAAYARWRDMVDLDHLDGASVRMLPFLATRLAALGIDDRWFAKYRGVQKLAWAQNQLLFAAARPVIAALRAEGILPLMLKGAALSSSVYPRASMRPMGDLDLLVPRNQTPRAIERLLESGWRPRAAIPGSDASFAVQHALTFIAPQGSTALEIDLHWRLFPWWSNEAGERALREKTVAIESLWDGAFAPGAADLLVHVCGHGASWNPLPPIRWVADATMIVRRGGVDWDHVLRQSERFQVVLPMTAALDYLHRAFDVPVPAEVLRTLATTTSAPVARVRFALDQFAPDRRPFLPNIRYHLHRARTSMSGSHRFLRYAVEVNRDRTLPQTARWLWQRARQTSG